MFNFSLQIDDDDHTLSASNGISMDKIADLLKHLYNSIDMDNGVNCTLSGIRGNCYALDFITQSEKQYNNFLVVHKNIEQIPITDLEPDQRKYANTLKSIIGGKYYVKAYDSNKQVIASIKDLNQEKKPNYFYSQRTIYGIVSELGGKRLDSASKHIFIDGFDYRIYINTEQDLQLKEYYGTHKLRVKIQHKHSVTDGHIINASLLAFEAVGQRSISESLKEVGYIDFEYLKNIHNINDIINKIYGDK